LEACIRAHQELIKPETAQIQLQLSHWAPIIFESPTQRFLSVGKKFVSSLGPLEHSGRELEYMIGQVIVACTQRLSSLCDETLSPCTGDVLQKPYTQGRVSQDACIGIQGPEELLKAARAWNTMASLIRSKREVFSSTWDLVEVAQEKGKVTEEWTASVIERWIALLEEMSSDLGGMRTISSWQTCLSIC